MICFISADLGNHTLQFHTMCESNKKLFKKEDYKKKLGLELNT